MHMRPFNPNVEDIDMYLEEAKERHLVIPNQDVLKRWAAKVNAQNEEIVKRDEPSRQHQTLKKNLEKDRIEEEKKTKAQKLKEKEIDYKIYLRQFDRRYHRGLYDTTKTKKVRKKNVPSTKSDPNAWPSIWSTSTL